MTITFNDQTIETDDQGYLIDFSLWTEELGGYMALSDGVKLTEDHWEVIRFVRQF